MNGPEELTHLDGLYDESEADEAREQAEVESFEDGIPCMACGSLQAVDGECRCWV